MESDSAANSPPAPEDSAGPAAPTDPGLPPVAPPSGKFILQLFLVPGLIVAVVVVVLIGAQWLFGGPLTPEKILKELRDSNPEVRWRMANDLAQSLPRHPELATNVDFGLSLVDLLDEAIEENQADEKAHREKTAKKSEDGKPGPAPKGLQTDRDTILFLLSALGHFQVPVGTDVLCKAAVTPTDMDAENDYRRRLYGVQALSQQGNNLKKYRELPVERRREIKAALREEAEGRSVRAGRAAQILEFLVHQEAEKPPRGLGAGDALVRCAAAKEPHIREWAALALTFWDAEGAEDALVKLLSDKGDGPDPVVRPENEEEFRKAHSKEMQRIYSKYVAYNAMQALVRRGSDRVKSHLNVLEEMLDEDRQMAVWNTDAPEIKSSREYVSKKIVHATLEALQVYLKKRPATDLIPLRDVLRRASESDNEAIRIAALEVCLPVKDAK